MKIEIQTYQLGDGRHIAVLDRKEGNSLVHITEDELDAVYGVVNDLVKGTTQKIIAGPITAGFVGSGVPKVVIRDKLIVASRNDQVVQVYYHDSMAYMTKTVKVIEVAEHSVRVRERGSNRYETIPIERIRRVETS